jgi:hypothetical protein
MHPTPRSLHPCAAGWLSDQGAGIARDNLTHPLPDIETEGTSRGEYWLQTGGRERLTFDQDTSD